MRTIRWPALALLALAACAPKDNATTTAGTPWDPATWRGLSFHVCAYNGPLGAIEALVADSAGAPLPHSLVRINADCVDVADSTGHARLAHVPAGTHTLQANAVGFLPETITVEVASGQLATVNLRLARRAEHTTH